MKEKQQQQQSIGSDGAKEIWTVLTTRDECKTSSVFFDVEICSATSHRNSKQKLHPRIRREHPMMMGRGL